MDGYCSRSPLTLINLFLQIIEILAPLVSTGFTDFVVLYDKFGEQGGLPVCCGTAVLCSGMTVISLVSFSPRIVLVFCQVAGLWRTLEDWTTYLGRDRSSRGTHPERTNLRPHEPSRWTSGFSPDATSGNLRTGKGKENEIRCSTGTLRL